MKRHSPTLRAFVTRRRRYRRRHAANPFGPQWPGELARIMAGARAARGRHPSVIGPTAGGKTPAGAHTYSLSPDGRRLTLVRQP